MLKSWLRIDSKIFISNVICGDSYSNFVNDSLVIISNCVGWLFDKLIKYFWKVSKFLIDLSRLHQSWKKVHHRSNTIIRVSDTANNFITFVSNVIVIPFWIMTFPYPHWIINDFFTFEICKLQVYVEFKGHVRTGCYSGDVW